MSFLESLSKQINPRNVDINKVAYGTPGIDNQNELLIMLSKTTVPNHYKDIFICRAMTTKDNPVFAKPRTENLVIWDCRDWYINKINHQKKRNYFIVPKDLAGDEIRTLSRVAILSQIENTKKSIKYYCDLLECPRSTFKDKYMITLDLFCKNIDNNLHNIEMQAQRMR